MELYVIESNTNYGTEVFLVQEENENLALKKAKENGAWDNATVEKVDLSTKGLVYMCRNTNA